MATFAAVALEYVDAVDALTVLVGRQTEPHWPEQVDRERLELIVDLDPGRPEFAVDLVALEVVDDGRVEGRRRAAQTLGARHQELLGLEDVHGADIGKSLADDMRHEVASDEATGGEVSDLPLNCLLDPVRHLNGPLGGPGRATRFEYLGHWRR